MKLDNVWPPSPRPGIRPERALKAELPPAREIAVAHLARFASLAESHLVTGEGLLPDETPFRSPEVFVQSVLGEFLSSSPTGVVDLPPPDFASLRVRAEAGGAQPLRPLNGRLFVPWAAQLADHPNVMLIDVKRYWGVAGLGPMRGDIAVFGDGHVAIVTEPLCRGCHHFTCAEFTPRSEAETAPTIRSRTHWTSTITHLVRLVIETPIANPES
jgi:hypothetical protein